MGRPEAGPILKIRWEGAKIVVKILLDALFAILLCIAARCDRRTHSIPNRIPALMGVLGLVEVARLLYWQAPALPQVLALLLTIPLFLFWTLGLIGGGDVKLLFAMCLHLGIYRTALAAAIALTALVLYRIYAAQRGKTTSNRIALAPALALGGVGALAGQYLLMAMQLSFR